MFKDRIDAGRLLAFKLRKVVNDKDFVVAGITRGGVVTAKEVANYFKIPLFPLSVKKIGAPLNPELAIGAVTFDGTYYFDEDLIKHLDVGQDYIKNSLENKQKEAKLLQKKFPTTPGLRGASKVSLKNKKVIIVDDGVATGATVTCASKYVRRLQPKEIILATPVIAKDTLKNIKIYFDKVISLKITDNLTSVSQFYKSFPQITDEEVINFLV